MIVRIVLLVVVLVVAVALAHQLDGRVLRVRGVVVPVSEWALKATQDGVVEQLQRSGVTAWSRGRQNVRGDPLEITLLDTPETGDTVRAGQPLALIVFPLESHGLATSSCRLDGAHAKLRMLEAGPRREAVAAGKAKARSAALAAARAITEASRACSLAARNLIALEEYERVRATGEVAQADADAAQAELDLLLAGARPEELDAVRAEIAALEAEVAEARDRAETTVVVAPMDGVVGDQRPECLIVLQKTDTVLVALPLDRRAWDRVQPGDLAEITGYDKAKSCGRVMRLSQSASVVGTSVSMAAFVVLPNSELRLRPGMTVRAAIATRGS